METPQKVRKVLRDRVKTRHFDAAWDEYSQAFKDYFLSLKRAGRTAYINQNIQKTGPKSFDNNVMSQFVWMEKVKKTKQREQEVASEGCIQEIAECKLGGRDRLEKAVKRGFLGPTLEPNYGINQNPTFSPKTHSEGSCLTPPPKKKLSLIFFMHIKQGFFSLSSYLPISLCPEEQSRLDTTKEFNCSSSLATRTVSRTLLSRWLRLRPRCKWKMVPMKP